MKAKKVLPSPTISVPVAIRSIPSPLIRLRPTMSAITPVGISKHKATRRKIDSNEPIAKKDKPKEE